MASLDLAICGGVVVDGTGRPGRRTDVGVADGRIVALGELGAADAARRVEASGRIVCPGFIDAHGHSDLSILSDPRARSKVHQGVTTEIVGNCGLGVAPLAAGAAAERVREAIFIVDPDPSVPWHWRSTGEYLHHVEKSGVAMNIASLAGHLPLRASVVGFDDRPATPDELAHMEGLLDDALDDGAVGLSTGLMYAPLSFAPINELIALGRIVERHGAVFALHLRNYGDELLAAVAEALRVGEESGCRIQVSHLAAAGRRNWGKVSEALVLLDAARDRGVCVRADIYPYLAGSANLSQLLPVWAHEGGTAAMVERLRRPTTRQRIRREWRSTLALGWEEILVCWVRPGGDTGVVGRTVADIARERGAEADTVALDLIASEEGRVSMIAFGRAEEDLRAALTHPQTMVGSDGLAVDPDGPSGSGHPHPRYYGCYPRLLETYVRRERVLTLETAVRKSTSLVAETFGLQGRGVVAEGKMADLVVFDAGTVTDQATFLDPQRFPTGIELVVVNGTVVVDSGRHTGALPGRTLRGR